MTDINVPTQSADAKVFPGPAALLIRACLDLQSYEIKFQTKEVPSKGVLTRGSCIDLESGTSTARYQCQGSGPECAARQAIEWWGHYKGTGQGKVATTYWAQGLWAPYADFVKHNMVGAIFRLEPSDNRTTIALLQSPRQYKLCLGKPGSQYGSFEVDGTMVQATDPCVYVTGRSIDFVRTAPSPTRLAGEFTRADD